MPKKEKCPSDQLRDLAKALEKDANHWRYINEAGCHDPFWPDGCNMNLVRNHVIADKRQIAEFCEKHHMDLPPEYYIPTPPEVDNHYMAAPSLKCEARVKRITEMGDRITTKKAEDLSPQMSLF